MNEEQLKKLFSDDAFMASILEMETAEEVQKSLADKGLELSLDEIAIIKNTLNSEETELSEDDLKAISGGVAITSVICGIIIGSAAASGAFTLGKAVHSWTNRRW